MESGFVLLVHKPSAVEYLNLDTFQSLHPFTSHRLQCFDSRLIFFGCVQIKF